MEKKTQQNLINLEYLYSLVQVLNTKRLHLIFFLLHSSLSTRSSIKTWNLRLIRSLWIFINGQPIRIRPRRESNRRLTRD